MAKKPTYEELEKRIIELEKESVGRKRLATSLTESEQRFRLLFDNMSIGVALVDKNGYVLAANEADCRFLCYSQEEIKGMHFKEFTYSEDLDLDVNLYEDLIKGTRDHYCIDKRYLRKDGKIVWGRLSVSLVKDDAGEPLYTVISCEDIDKRKKSEEALHKRAGEFAALYETSLDITKTHDLSTLLETIVKRATQLLNCSSGGLYICDPDRKEARNVVSYKTPHDYTGTLLKYGEGAAGIVAQTGEPLIIDDYRTWSKRATVFKKDQPFSSVISVPMIWQDDVIGVIHVLNYEETRSFTQSDLDLITLFASQAVIAVNNARLVEQVQSHTAKLQKRVIEVEERTAELEKVNKQLEKEIKERKQAEETLQREKLLSDSIIDNMPAGIAFLDNDFILKKCNPAYAELIRIYTPYSPEQAIGMSYFDYVPGSRSQVEEWFQKVKDSGQGETRHGFKLVVERDGQEEATYWDTSIAPVLESSGNVQGILILTQDVTERHRAKEVVRDSEYYYRSLIHSMHEDILVIAPDYRIIDVNNTFLVTLKTKREDVIGRHCFEVSHGYNEPCTMYGEDCLLDGVFDTGEPQYCRHIHQTVDGSRVWVDILFSPLKDEKGKVTHVIEAMRDVTDLIEVEEKLKKSEEKYRLLVENANDAIFIVQDEVVKFPNPKTEELTGYSAEELARIPFVNLIHPDDREMVLDRRKRRLEGEKIPSTYSFRILNRAGIELWIQLNTVLIEWELRPATLNFIRDITQQKKMEDQFQQAQKMEAIGTLAGGIAHDFNNLLMGIQGRASLMLMDTTTTNSHYEHLEGIEDYVKSAADLTNQLLAFARGGKYEVKPTNINELIKKENRMFGRTKKEITIRGKYEKDLWVAEVDQGQIEQVLLNLYVNAWQSMPGGGNLYIQTENVALDENYPKPFEVKPGKYVKISVTDTGVGMDETTRQRIFEPFFTTKEMGRGTGLGLASVYGIIKNHEGFINVYSEKGEGATFNIYLPAAEAKGIEQRAKSEDKDKIARGTETVLLVDDENVIIYTVERVLKEMGYKTLIARSGKETVKIYKKNKDKIDVVILDMIMPDMGGGETYDILKEINPDIKVLLSSGYSLNDKATMILERGCNGFIQKPYRSNELSQKIRKILDKD